MAVYNGKYEDISDRYVEKKSVDCIVTSPPYNIGIKYNSYNDQMPEHHFREWLHYTALVMREQLKRDGSLFLVLGFKASEPFHELAMATVFNTHFVLQNKIIWVKSYHDPETDQTAGHFKPINSERYLNNCYETIYHFTHTGEVPLQRKAIGVPYTDKSNIQRWNGKEDLRCRGNAWFLPYKTAQSAKQHPASFPVELAEMCLKLHGVSSDSLVLDPFCGVGSTLIAAKRLDAKYIGFDIDPMYIEIAKRELKGNE